MIARLWRGWTTTANADAYEALVRSEILPGIHRIPGYRGVRLLRREAAEGVEFVSLTFFDSMEAVKVFAGENYEKAVVSPEARRLLSRFDERSEHFEVMLEKR